VGRRHLSLAVLAACAAAALLAGAAAATAVPSRPLARGAVLATGGAPAPIVVRTRADARRAGQLMQAGDRRRLLALDLSTRAAVVVFRAFPSCGHEVFVVRLDRTAQRLRVDYGTSGPPGNAMVCQALTIGYDAVSVPRAAVAGVTRVTVRTTP
jgi:hypothetical protein